MCRFHETDSQNACDHIARDRRSRRTWSNCVLCIPFILSGSPNRCRRNTCDACVITTWRWGWRAPLVARNDFYYYYYYHYHYYTTTATATITATATTTTITTTTTVAAASAAATTTKAKNEQEYENLTCLANGLKCVGTDVSVTHPSSKEIARKEIFTTCCSRN